MDLYPINVLLVIQVACSVVIYMLFYCLFVLLFFIFFYKYTNLRKTFWQLLFSVTFYLRPLTFWFYGRI